MRERRERDAARWAEDAEVMLYRRHAIPANPPSRAGYPLSASTSSTPEAP